MQMLLKSKLKKVNLMVKKQFKNIYGKTINVDGKSRESEEVFEDDNKRKEIITLCKNGYLEEMEDEN